MAREDAARYGLVERGRARLAAGIDYGFRLDGGDPLPDPRSPRQPFGIKGLSRT